MRRAIPVIALVLAIACAGGQGSNQAVLASLRAAMNGAQEASQAAEDASLVRLRADLAAIPDGPDRPAKVEARKAQARAEVAAIRAKRDKVLALVQAALALEAGP